MARNDPTYVKLADSLVRQMVVDMRTGWSLSGLDVKPFPDSPLQASYARAALGSGKLIEATEEEYNDAHPAHNDLTDGVVGFPHDEVAMQEAQLHHNATQARLRIEASRGLGGSVPNYEADQARREALIAAQRGDKVDVATDGQDPTLKTDPAAGLGDDDETVPPPVDDKPKTEHGKKTPGK